MRWRLALIWLVLAVVAYGCGAVGLERPSPLTARVVMTESGGIAGIVNVLTVEPNYTVTYQTREGTRLGKLTEQGMEKLVAFFYDNGFFSLEDDYRPKQPIADGITISIVYIDARRSKTVLTVTNADDPASLRRLLVDLKSLIQATY